MAPPRLLVRIFTAMALAIGLPGSAHAFSGEYFITCNLNPYGDNFLSLRTCGSTRCPEIARLGPNTFLIATQPYAVQGWREVIVLNGLQDQSYSGPRGWVYTRYICAVRY